MKDTNQLEKSTKTSRRVRTKSRSESISSKPNHDNKKLFEDMNLSVSEDKLARESDVTVSANLNENTEYRGFFVYILTSVVMVCWMGWALLPDKVLQDYLSIYYYPDKYWSMAIPCYFLVWMLFCYIGLALINTEVLTIPLDDIRNFADEFTIFPSEMNKNIVDYIHQSPSGVWDLPITLVNEVLYDDDDDCI